MKMTQPRILASILLLSSSVVCANDSVVTENWKSLDANGDGKVTTAENRSNADKVFKKVDANGDGTVTREEYEAAMKNM